MIRRADISDIPELVEMGRKFHKECGQPCGFDPDAVVGLLERMIASPDAVVLRSENGGIGGMLSPAFCDPSWIMAVELFWWAKDRQGIRLLRAFEQWAESKGVNETRTCVFANLPGANRILERMEYIPSEISYQKVA